MILFFSTKYMSLNQGYGLVRNSIKVCCSISWQGYCYLTNTIVVLLPKSKALYYPPL